MKEKIMKKKERKKERKKEKLPTRSRIRCYAITNPHTISRLKSVKPVNVNKSTGQPDDVSKTLGQTL